MDQRDTKKPLQTRTETNNFGIIVPSVISTAPSEGTPLATRTEAGEFRFIVPDERTK